MNADLAAQRAFRKLKRSGFDALTEREKSLATVWLFDAKVANGGFEGFFSSASGDVAFYAPTALKAIGAVQMAEIATKANSVFGLAGPPRDRKTRAASVQTFGEAARKGWEVLEGAFYDCAEDLDDLLELYANRAEEA